MVTLDMLVSLQYSIEGWAELGWDTFFFSFNVQLIVYCFCWAWAYSAKTSSTPRGNMTVPLFCQFLLVLHIFSYSFRTCEICGATARNAAGESANEASDVNGLQIITMEPLVPSETRSVWHGRRIMNILLACMVLAFVISWLFHFDVLPWIYLI